MDRPVLTDESVFPTDDILAVHLGRTLPLWTSFFDFLHAQYPDVAKQWKYYNDGKSWLMKVSRKSKTVFWLSVVQGRFRITAYFTDKARTAIQASTLSDDLKEQFKASRKIGALRGVNITFRKKKDVEDAKALVGVKVSLL
jgi:hypothetical protein